MKLIIIQIRIQIVRSALMVVLTIYGILRKVQ